VPAMIVQPGERNAYDQQWIQQQLWSAHGVDMVRLSLNDIGQRGSLDASGNLLVDGKVISVAYFRWVPGCWGGSKCPCMHMSTASMAFRSTNWQKCVGLSQAVPPADSLTDQLARPRLQALHVWVHLSGPADLGAAELGIGTWPVAWGRHGSHGWRCTAVTCWVTVVPCPALAAACPAGLAIRPPTTPVTWNGRRASWWSAAAQLSAPRRRTTWQVRGAGSPLAGAMAMPARARALAASITGSVYTSSVL
jgi:hypothetical protein